MRKLRLFPIGLALLALVWILAACGGDAGTTPPANTAASTPVGGAVVPTVGTPPAAQANYCQNAGVASVKPGDKLAAQVNGQGIPLAVFDQQAAQSQIALTQQGVDPNSAQGKEAIKGLRQQVLDQLIDDALVEQAASAAKVNITAGDINDRVQQVVNDAGGKDKFNAYLTNNQLTLDDLCQQIRSNLYGEAMMTQITANLPTKVEQVHVAHILFAKKEDADAALKKLQAGTDFATLAKQLSQDEATRDNGGDLGWFPRNVMPPEFDQAAFALQPGQISPVVSTQLGLHIIKLLERDPNRALTPELIQNQRLAAFNTWLDTQRSQAKIVKLVQE